MDPSKFFNRKINIRNPKTPYNKGKFVDESENYSNRISSRINQSPLTKSLFSLRNKVFQIENLLNGIFSLDKKKQEQNKKIKAAEVPDKKPKTKGPQLFGKLIQKPKTGALDLIRDFVTFTFLGWLFTRIQPLLGGLTKLASLLEGMAWFIGGTIKNMVDIFATFLKLGFDVKDKFDSIVGDIKKNTKGIDKTFDNTLNPLKAVFEGVIQLANSFLSVSVKEDQLNEARTQLAKEETVDKVPSMPPMSKVDAPQTPQTPDAFPRTPTRPGVVQGAYTGGVIRGYNNGGNLNQGRIDPRTPITRGVESQRREVTKPKPIIQPQKSAPGKDVGGDRKIKELYDSGGGGIADFIPLPSFFRTDKKSGFAALMGASEEYKKPMTNDILGIGNMMGASVDSALGQKIEKKSYTQFADGIKYLVNYGRTQPEEFAKIDLEDMVRKIVEPRVNMAINRIQEEINKKGKVEVDSGEGGGGGFTGGEYGGYSPTSGLEKEIYDYLINVKKMNDMQALGLMANISRESSFVPNIRERGGTGVGLFQWSHGRVAPFIRAVPDWETNWKAQIDYALSEPERLSLVAPGEYQAKNFSSAQEAADWWMNEWERPADPTSGSKKHQQYLANVPRSPEGTAKFRSGSFGGVEAMGAGFRTGLKTGPAGRIGAGTEYHVDARIVPDLPLRDKIAMIDSMASAHSQEGYVMEFSGRGVAGLRWDPNMSYSEKEKLARKVLKSHWAARSGWEPFDYFIVKKTARDRYDVSAQGSNIMAPRISGGSYVYGEDGGRGRFLSIRDKNGREIFQVMHGDRGVPSPKKIGQIFKINELKGTSTSQRPSASRQSPKPEIQRITQTPPGEPYLIKGKMYYVDLKNNKVFTTNEKGDRVEVKVGPGQNEWLLKEIYKLRQLRQNQRISFSKISPTTPADKYASYEQPGSQEPLVAIQPVIMTNQIPVPVSSGPVAFVNPRISSSKSNLA